MRRLALRLLVPTILLALAACSDDDTAATSATSSGSATASTSASSGGGAGEGGSGGAIATSASSGGASGGQGGGGQGGGSAHDGLLPGDWKPTGVNDSGMGIMPADPAAPFFVFTADGKLGLAGCGVAPMATWSFSEGGVPNGVGVITVKFGSTTIMWYVLELTETKFVFGEGGDLFYFERSKC